VKIGKQTRPLSLDELRLTFERAVLGKSPVDGHGMHAGNAERIETQVSGDEPALNIACLMSLDDQAFVEAAYLALLKRRPDDAGQRSHLTALAAGQSRITVLGALRYSPEGSQVAVPVPGLRNRLLVHRLYNIRFLGRGLRTLAGIIALPGLMRDTGKLHIELNQLRARVHDLGQRHEHEVRGLAEQAVERAREAVHDLGRRVDKLASQAQAEPWADPLVALAEQVDHQASRIARLEAADADAHALKELGEALAALREELGGPENTLTARFLSLLQDHRNVAIRALATAEGSQALLRDQERRLSLILGDVRRLAAHGPDASTSARFEQAQADLLDPLYVAFEDRFRGSRADIKQRQQVYLDLLTSVGAGSPERPIVDVGSGRGELLEMLGEAGLQARGVDLNQSMVSLCAEAGLDVVHDDAVAYLSRLEPATLGAVTGFHIIEHLPFPAMVALIDASLHALAPGGIVIFETPNPANLLVASRWFYLDPTHRNPLPGEMVAMIAEARGFIDIEIRELHPMQRRFEANDHVLAGQLDAIFHGPQDYALIARKA
jgi:2-polyprenyl-3-methyl-5-hydroxy-6-metoxy-1,4-benzoquinol methylase